MSKPIKKDLIQKFFKFPKTKRTHYEAKGWVQEKNLFKKEKNEPNSKNINLFKEAEKKFNNKILIIYSKFNYNNKYILITQDISNLLQNNINDEEFINIIDISGDGNCLFSSFSFYIFIS